MKRQFFISILAFIAMSIIQPLAYALSVNEAQKLLAGDGVEDDEFGYSVSLSGDTAVIGAFLDDDNGSQSGSAYVFVRNGTGVWVEQQKLLASDAAYDDRFGSSVSVSDDTAVISAVGNDDNGDSSGSAYVFVRDGSGVWREQQKLLASDAAENDYFGRSVSVSGDTAMIGAYEDDNNTGDFYSSVYVFERDGTGVWREQQKLTASDAAAFDEFGRSVSVSGDTAVIGASWNVYYSSGDDSGSAYVFERDGTGVWREQQKLTASDAVGDNLFGISVSLSGDTAVIGANYYDGYGPYSGSAYVFERDGTGVWREQQKLTASDVMLPRVIALVVPCRCRAIPL